MERVIVECVLQLNPVSWQALVKASKSSKMHPTNLIQEILEDHFSNIINKKNFTAYYIEIKEDSKKEEYL